MSAKIRIRVNPSACNGCLSCTTNCSMVNELYVSLSAARLRIELNPFGGRNKIVLCRQCGKAPCVDACKPGAIMREPCGVLVIDYELCDACKACIKACPLQAIFWNPIGERVIKCELCEGEPQCVLACPTGALTVQMVPEIAIDKGQ